jgi:carbon-monoxide dehydrogenase medium subunit
VADATALLARYPGAKLLAGGHSLIPLLKLRLSAPSALVDIGHIAELRGIAVEGDTIRIGALTTHAELATSRALAEHSPALAEAARLVGDPAVRNRGTIGGNVAHADPASDLPTVLTAVGATFVASNASGQKRVEVHEFFNGMMSTALADGDLLTAIEVPIKQPGQGVAYVKFQHPASRYAVIGVAAAVTVKNAACTAAAVAIGGLLPRPTRAQAVESSLIGRPLTPDAIASAAARADHGIDPDEVLGDLFASAEYRTAVAPVWVKRALNAAAVRAR